MKKIFKKVFKSFKKILKPIGKELKKGLKSAGKAFGKLGPVGTLALSLMLPGLGTVMGSLGTVIGNVAATAPFAGTIMAPVGQVISGVAKVAQAGGKVFNSISKYVGDTVNGLTGGSFKGEMVSKEVTNEVTGKVTTEMVKNQGYKKGMSTKFSDWVGAKIDKTRRTFGLETSMDSKGFESSLASNKEALSGVQSTTDIKNYAQSVEGQLDKSLSTFDINKTPTPDIDYKLPKGDGSIDSILSPDKVSKNKFEVTTDGLDVDKAMKDATRETVNVPIGQTTAPAKELSKFGDFNKTNIEYKEIYKDELSPEQFSNLNIEDTEYFANFQNNRVDTTQKWFDGKYKNPDGTFTDDYATLTKDKFDMQMVRQDAGAIAKPAAFVGSMLAPEETPQGTGSSGYVAPLSTEVDVKQYQQGAERAYAEYGYKGPNTMGGFHMEGAFGNTPINYFQKGQRTQSTMTTALPTLG
tara:strand:+ start:2012 stop:3409 length:1398 start_codon:yes stop_codon:yes gene_type:complete